MGFHSYYWNNASLPPELAAALDQLNNIGLPVLEKTKAFYTLLESDSTEARGIAMDRFSLYKSQERHGDVNRDFIRTVAPAVRAVARQELEAPQYVRAEGGPVPRGANHASALNAIWHLGRAEDAPLVARVLMSNDAPGILEVGLRAASSTLFRERKIDPELGRVLHGIATNPQVAPELRRAALHAVGVSRADEVTPWFVTALADPVLEVASAGGRLLLERDATRFRDMVAQVAASWPSEGKVPYDVTEVRRLLE